MSLHENSDSYVVAAGKLSPPIAVTGGLAAGYSLQDWVLIATLVYTIVQFAFLIVDRIKKYRNGG